MPSGCYEDIWRILAHDGDAVEVLKNSIYHTGKISFVRDGPTETHKIPVVEHVYTSGQPKIIFTDIDRGGRDAPKLLFGRRCSGLYLDEGEMGFGEGAFAIAQDSMGIKDSVEILEKIKITMESDSFKKIMSFCSTDSVADSYNYKVFKYFRKDFWKEFL